MSLPHDDNRSSMAQSAPSWGGALAMFVVFASVAAAVWGVGSRQEGRSASYTAAATVFQTPPIKWASDGTTTSDSVDLKAIEQQITSIANLRRALARLNNPDNPDETDEAKVPNTEIDRLRSNLEVTVVESTESKPIEIAVAYRDDDPRQVIKLVNLLALQYTEDHHARVRAAASRTWSEVRESAAAARENLLVARKNLDDFLARHFQEYREPTDPPNTPTDDRVVRSMPIAKPGVPPRMVASPEWKELQQQRQALIEQREILLETRTLHHPAVHALTQKIERLDQVLASKIPAQAYPLTGTGVSNKSTIKQASLESLTQAELAARPLVRQYLALKAAVDQTQLAYDRACEPARGAASRWLQSPEVEFRPAQQWQTDVVGNSSRLLLVALVSGLALAAGTGMMASGLNTAPTLESTLQAKAALPLAVVGTVPVESMHGNAPQSSWSSGRARAVLGALLIGICGAALFAYFARM